MKNVVKRPLKLMAAAAFMVALGYGVSTNSKVSELSSFVNLSALSSVSAQGEEGGNTACCIGSNFKIKPIEGGWKCLNDQGSSCCPICI